MTDTTIENEKVPNVNQQRYTTKNIMFTFDKISNIDGILKAFQLPKKQFASN